jgi:hypothetical protein
MVLLRPPPREGAETSDHVIAIMAFFMLEIYGIPDKLLDDLWASIFDLAGAKKLHEYYKTLSPDKARDLMRLGALGTGNFAFELFEKLVAELGTAPALPKQDFF